MTVNVNVRSNYVADAVLGALGPEGRKECFSVAAAAVKNAVQRHIRSYMSTKHHSADRLNARRSGHYEKGAAAITWDATASGGVVRIPIPGLGRAWHDVTIRPGPGKRALTLPMAAVAYGRKVYEVRALGWRVWTPKGTGWIMGMKENDDTPTLLYVLKGGVVQRRDPSLLPAEGELAATGAEAIHKHVSKAVAKARKGGLK